MSKFGMLSVAAATITLAVPAAADAVILGPDAATCANGIAASSSTSPASSSAPARFACSCMPPSRRSSTRARGSSVSRSRCPPRGPPQSACPSRVRANTSFRSVTISTATATDIKDGGGFSGNPDVKLSDLFSKRKPTCADEVRGRRIDRQDQRRAQLCAGLSFEPVGDAEPP